MSRQSLGWVIEIPNAAEYGDSMYKWPTELNPKVFCGFELEQISFSANTLGLGFSGNCLVSVESSITLIVNGCSEHLCIPTTSIRILSLIGLAVTSSALDADGASLILEFENGWKIKLEGSDEVYECFSIRIDKSTYII